ncbi:hypothetical protein ACFV1L_24700 [Kitasatospora sp. NPDC059646]|uniref:hypothetical protein n=1 Tax=Kitasatospora sp. NPDC059646 TaxID=3346893 RepID=UPI00367F05EE
MNRLGPGAAAAAALCLTVTPAAAAADGGPRAGGSITCVVVGADGPNVLGSDCRNDQWGPLSDFVLTDGNTSYSCRTGWAEGPLWVNGQNCRQS